MQALHTAATGMAAQELNVQVISNNIANLRTTGYKKQTAAFQDLIYEHVRRVGAQASDQGTILPVGIDLGGGVKTVGTPRSMTQGTLSQTGNDLDLAITGEGFFKIQMPDGTFQYTRDGTFQMDNQGRVVTAQGNPVQPTITIPQNASGITVNAQGQVSVTLPGSTTSTIIGQIGADPLHQQGRPAAGRQQPVHRHALLRRAAGRHRQCRRFRQHHARQPRTGQCRRRLRDERPDRRAARLRDERQGDLGRRPDDAIDHRAVPLTEVDHDDAPSPPRRRAARSRRRAGPCRPGDAAPSWRPHRSRCRCCAPTVTVTADVVRIGDVIDNAGSAAQIAIYRAPDLGTTGSLPTAQVIAALRAHQVIGVDTSDIKEVTVTRLARNVEAKDIEDAVARALEHRGGLGDAANLIAHLRPRPAGHAARRLQHRRDAGDCRALRAAQRPLRRHLRDRQRQQRARRPSCASPAPRSRRSRSRC